MNKILGTILVLSGLFLAYALYCEFNPRSTNTNLSEGVDSFGDYNAARDFGRAPQSLSWGLIGFCAIGSVLFIRIGSGLFVERATSA